MTVPGVSTLMGLIEEALRDKFFPVLFGGEEINSDFRKILDHSIKHGSLCIPHPQMSEESAHNISKAASGKLVGSLLEGNALNYVVQRACVCGASTGARKEGKHVELAYLARKRSL